MAAGAALGGKIGGWLGAGKAAFDVEKNEAVGEAMSDPEILASRSARDIDTAGNVKGAVAGGLEMLVPGLFGARLLGKGVAKEGAKSLIGETAKQTRRNFGKQALKEGGKGAAEEWGTEGLQALSGQAAQNWLKGKSLTDFDYGAALDEAMAGAVGGGLMGGVGGAVGLAHDYRRHLQDKATDTANRFREDPAEFLADGLNDVVFAAGTGAAKLRNTIDRIISPAARDYDDLVNTDPKSVSAQTLHEKALRHASEVLDNPDKFDEAQREHAAEFIQTQDAEHYVNKLTNDHHKNEVREALTSITNELEETLPERRESRMNARGDPAVSLAQLWFEREASKFRLFKNADRVGERENAHRVSTLLMEWVRSGFATRDGSGEVRIPTTLVDELGADAPKVILSMAKMVKAQGLYEGDEQTLAEVVSQFEEQTQRRLSDEEFVKGMLTPLAEGQWTGRRARELAELLRAAKGQIPPGGKGGNALRKGLEDTFGPNTDTVLDYFATPRPGLAQDVRYDPSELGGEMDESGEYSSSDERQGAETDYESDMSEREAPTRTLYRGLGKNDTPYDTRYANKKDQLATDLSTAQNDKKQFARKIGAWTALKEQFGDRPEYLRHAETEALVKSMGGSEAARAEVEAMSEAERASSLKAYDRTFKLLKVVETVSDPLPDAVAPDEINGLREKSLNRLVNGKWVDNAGNTPNTGRLYLERKSTVNKDTGETKGKDEHFLTSTQRLIKHVQEAQARQGTGGTLAEGALGLYQAFQRGLAALIESDGTFTGRVGIGDGKGGVTWLEDLVKEGTFTGRTVSYDEDGKTRVTPTPKAKAGIPASLPNSLALFGKISVGHARAQLKEAGTPDKGRWTESGEMAPAQSPESDYLSEAGDEIQTESDRYDRTMIDAVPAKGAGEAQKDTLLAEGPQGVIHRDERGVQKGLGKDVEGMALGGNARGGGNTPVLEEDTAAGRGGRLRGGLPRAALKGVDLTEADQAQFFAAREFVKTRLVDPKKLSELRVTGLVKYINNAAQGRAGWLYWALVSFAKNSDLELVVNPDELETLRRLSKQVLDALASQAKDSKQTKVADGKRPAAPVIARVAEWWAARVPHADMTETARKHLEAKKAIEAQKAEEAKKREEARKAKLSAAEKKKEEAQAEANQPDRGTLRAKARQTLASKTGLDLLSDKGVPAWMKAFKALAGHLQDQARIVVEAALRVRLDQLETLFYGIAPTKLTELRTRLRNLRKSLGTYEFGEMLFKKWGVGYGEGAQAFLTLGKNDPVFVLYQTKENGTRQFVFASADEAAVRNLARYGEALKEPGLAVEKMTARQAKALFNITPRLTKPLDPYDAFDELAPFETTKAPVVPVNEEAAARVEALTHGQTRRLTAAETALLTDAIERIVPGVKRRMGAVVHVGMMSAEYARKRNLSGQARNFDDGRTVILLNPNLFAHKLNKLGRVFAHEVAHSFDETIDLSRFVRGGEIDQLAMAAPVGSIMQRALKYPRNIPGPSKRNPHFVFEKELHAQLYGMFMHPKGRKALLEDTPALLKIMEEMYGQETNGNRSNAQLLRGSHGRGLGSTGDRGAVATSQGRRDQPGGSPQGSGGVAGDGTPGGRRDERGSGAEARSPAEVLTEYLARFGDRDAFWKVAAGQALRDNNATQIERALAVARKKFGELEGAVPSVDKPVARLPMYYKILNTQRLRPELRGKYTAQQSIAALIPNGDRTGTTRRPPPGVKVGDVVEFEGVEGRYRVTEFAPVDLSTPQGREEWSRHEGWSPEASASFGSQVRTGAVQMRFERVDGAPAVLSTPGNGTPLPKSKWLSEAAITQIIEERIGQFAHQPPVLIVDSASEVPFLNGAKPGDAMGATYGGKIYLFRDTFAHSADVVQTLWHELSHYGLRRFLTREQYIETMHKLYTRDGWIKEQTDAWVDGGGSDVEAARKIGHDYMIARGVDEALSKLAEINEGEYTNNSLIQRAYRQVMRWIAAFAESKGFHRIAAMYRKASNYEARDLVRSMFRKLREDAPATSRDWAFTADPAFRTPDDDEYFAPVVFLGDKILKRLTPEEIEDASGSELKARDSATSAEELARLATHPDSFVRRGVVGNKNIHPYTLGRLSEDPNSVVRATVAKNEATPRKTLIELSYDEDTYVLFSLARNGKCPPEALSSLAVHEDRKVRAFVASNPNTPEHLLKTLAADHDPRVQIDVARNPRLPVPLLEKFAQSNDDTLRACVAGNPSTPVSLLDKFLKAGDAPIVLGQVAKNPRATVPMLIELSRHKHRSVREAAAESPRLPPEVLLSMLSEPGLAETVYKNPSTPVEALKKRLREIQKDPAAHIRELAAIINSGRVPLADVSDASVQGVTRWRREVGKVLSLAGDTRKLSVAARRSGMNKAQLLSIVAKTLGIETRKDWLARDFFDGSALADGAMGEYRLMGPFLRGGLQSVGGEDHAISFFRTDLTEANADFVAKTNKVYDGHPPGFGFVLARLFDDGKSALITETQSDAMSTLFDPEKTPLHERMEIGEKEAEALREALAPVRKTWAKALFRNAIRHLFDTGVEKVYAITPEALRGTLGASPPGSVVRETVDEASARAEGFGERVTLEIPNAQGYMEDDPDGEGSDTTFIEAWDAIERESEAGREMRFSKMSADPSVREDGERVLLSELQRRDALLDKQIKAQFVDTATKYGGKAAYDKAKKAGKTKLNYVQWVQVRTPAFKKWFGDWENDPKNASKVIDKETGEPRVVYHGTLRESLDTFDAFGNEHLGWRTGALSARMGHFAAGKPGTAVSYTRGRPAPVEVAGVKASLKDALERLYMTALKREGFSSKQEVIDKYERLEKLRKLHSKIADERGEARSRKDFEGASKFTERLDALFEDIAKESFTDAAQKFVDLLIAGRKDHFSYLSFADDGRDILRKLEKERFGRRDPHTLTPAYNQAKASVIDAIEAWENFEALNAPILNLFLNIRNPEVRDFKALPYREEHYVDVLERAKDSKRDGAILKNTYDGGPLDDIFAFFDPKQAKSATDNSGAFSTETEKLRESQIGADLRARQASPEAVAAAVKYLADTVDIEPELKRWLGGNVSGAWIKRAKGNIIKLALNGDILGAAFHESLHEFFDMLRTHGAGNVTQQLEKVANNPVVIRQLNKLLKDHPGAIGQITLKDGMSEAERNEVLEERVAYMYQFWLAGQLKIGPQTRSFLQRVADFLRRVFRKVSAEVRDFEQAELILRAFSAGAVKDSATREAVIARMKESTEAHDAALEALAKNAGQWLVGVKRMLFSAEAMMELTGNKYMIQIARLANQKTGTGMAEKQAYFDAVSQQQNKWTNRLENILGLAGGDKEVLNIARESLATGKPTYHPEAKRIVEKLRAYFEDIHKYIDQRGARRWDEEAINQRWGTKGDWVRVPYRASYFPQAWSVDTLLAKRGEFVATLLKHHRAALEAIAAKANEEIAAVEASTSTAEAEKAQAKAGPAAKAAMEKSAAEARAENKIVAKIATPVVTAEQVAEAIHARLVHANGQADIAETTSNLGISPLAAAVNRRELDWIDSQYFDGFMEQDLVSIMTRYTSGMIKRAEYSHVFGPGGERLTEMADKAVLAELGGEALVEKSEQLLPYRVKHWKVSKAKALKEGREFKLPFPTLRSVGQSVHMAQADGDKALAELRRAIRKLDPGFKAVMAIEGTLGSDVSSLVRTLTSFLVVYSNLRLMVPGLFSSYMDVLGITVNGGTLGDAWTAFTRGMREVRLRWKNDKSQDAEAKRAEVWGTVEATAALDALGQTFGSMYLTGRMRRMNETLFKYNGMEAWNRAMRITATAVAERVIKLYKTDGVNMGDPAAVARFERLFGQGFDAKDIKLDADGNLDVEDVRNQQAVMRWVSDAIMRPNATHRTLWGSDPHWAAFWQYKQFSYTLHRVMLKGVWEQAKLGNTAPMMILGVGAIPVMIAADAVKEMLLPGDEPPWMKQGLGGLLSHGLQRAGIFGVPQLLWEGAGPESWDRGKAGIGLLGPSVGQAYDLYNDPVLKSVLGAFPAGGLLRRAA
jgi:hypothetical protein